VYVLRRVKLGRAEFTFISLWERSTAIRRFAGDITKRHTTIRKTAISSSELEPFVEHYDVLTELSLDPADNAGWEELRLLGHRMVDEMLEYLRTARERPVWRPVPAEVRERLTGPVRASRRRLASLRTIQADVLPYPTGNIHPRFWDG